MARLISASISPLVFIRMLPPNGGQMNSLVPSVPKASMVRTLSFILPRDAGDERGGGSEHEEIRSRSRGPQAILKKFFDFGFVETRELLFSLDDQRRFGSLSISLIASSFDGGFCFMFLSRYRGVRELRNFSMGRSPMISRSSLSENGCLPYSRSSKSTFFDCKKLLALRQVVQVAL